MRNHKGVATILVFEHAADFVVAPNNVPGTRNYFGQGETVTPPVSPAPIGASPRVPPSPTPLELVQSAKGQVPPAVDVSFEHIINGEVRTSVDAAGNVVKRGVGGHYTRSGNVRIVEVVEAADKNGVVVAKVEIRDPATGAWVPKRANSSPVPTRMVAAPTPNRS